MIISKFWLETDLSELVQQPWSIITHMLMHNLSPGGFLGGILHILFNMLWLYWFGRIFLSFQSQRRVLPIYLLGGLTGAAFMILAYNIFPVFSATTGLGVGASAAVMAIVFATVVLVPDYSIRLLLFGNVKIKYIGLVVLALDIISIPGGNPGGSIAHIGGAAFGALYMYQLRQGRDLGAWLNNFFDWVATVPTGWFKRKPRIVHNNPKKRRQKVTVKQGSGRKHKGPDQEEMDKQARIDAILDKIAESGYDSLNEDEKAFLFRVSKED
jgi:membrane associated rhomboid family serine protease